ncbi:unnamed protein product [Pedinophyceae sp. YPF-701]|nr:unnamed protein product [Pedinophyceae sp. YPF-701]
MKDHAVTAERILRRKREKEAATLHLARFNRLNPQAEAPAVVADVLEEEGDVDVAGVIRDLAQRGPIDLAWAVFEHACEVRGRPQPIEVYEAAIHACASNFQPRRCLQAYQMMLEDEHTPTTLECPNLAIHSCAHFGLLEGCMAIYKGLSALDLTPNSFTFQGVLTACSARGRGWYREALSVVEDMRQVLAPVQEEVSRGGEEAEGARDGGSSRVLVDLERMVFDACLGAVRKCQTLQQALEVFEAMEEVGLEEDPRVLLAVVRTCGKYRQHSAALDFFGQAAGRGVAAGTEVYNRLIEACVRGGDVESALEVFEWMVEGYGNSGVPVPATTETYNQLLRGCHQAGKFERGLEVLAWMQGVGLQPDQDTIDLLINTAEICTLWDTKIMSRRVAALTRVRHASTRASSVGNATDASLANIRTEALRSSEANCMRMLYLSQPSSVAADHLLATRKLGIDFWAPVGLRPAACGPTEEDLREEQARLDREARERVKLAVAETLGFPSPEHLPPLAASESQFDLARTASARGRKRSETAKRTVRGAGMPTGAPSATPLPARRKLLPPFYMGRDPRPEQENRYRSFYAAPRHGVSVPEGGRSGQQPSTRRSSMARSRAGTEQEDAWAPGSPTRGDMGGVPGMTSLQQFFKQESGQANTPLARTLQDVEQSQLDAAMKVLGSPTREHSRRGSLARVGPEAPQPKAVDMSNSLGGPRVF